MRNPAMHMKWVLRATLIIHEKLIQRTIGAIFDKQLQKIGVAQMTGKGQFYEGMQ